MRRRLVLCMLLAGTFSASVVWGHASEGEGTSPVGFGAVWLDAPHLGVPARIRFSMAGQYGGEGTAHLHLPTGLKLVEGDTLHRGRGMGPSKRWIVRILPERTGGFEIRGFLTVKDDDIVHELDLALPFHVEKDTATIESSHLTRLETVRGGQRYRYGGRFLVPIDQPESVTQEGIRREGTRATGPAVLETVCEECKGTSRTLPMVAFVGRDGRLVEARLRTPIKGVSDQEVAAAQRAVSGTQYRPAHLGGKAVADWVLIDVRVRPSK